MSFLKVFNKPHHSSTLRVRGLTHSVVATLIVISIAFLIKPFGLKTLDSSALLEVVITIGGITFIAMLFAQFLFPYIIKDFYKEENWTVSKQVAQLLIMSLIISLGSVFYLSTKKLAQFPVDALILFGASILPLIILAVVQQNMLEGKFLKLAEDKNHSLARKGVINSNNPSQIITIGNLNLIPNQLIYAKVIGNSTELYYQNLFGIEKSLVAINKEGMLKALMDNPQFTSFGNDYIININAIQQVSGTARGYELQIAKVNQLVKISSKERKKLEDL